MKPDISIITPTLNSEKYIENCIKSITSQKKINIQHIVVDGGSKDLTRNIVEKSNFSEFHLLNNSSIYEALNYGVDQAQASLIGFLNSDDTYFSNYIISEIIDIYKNNKSNIIIYGNCRFVNENGKVIYRLISSKNLKYKFAKKRIFNISHPCWFTDKKTFIKLGGYNTKFRYISDCDYILRALNKNIKFSYLGKDVCNFLIHSNNKSNSQEAKKELINYINIINGNRLRNKIEYYLFTVFLYLKDPRYFFFKINKFSKQYFKF